MSHLDVFPSYRHSLSVFSNLSDCFSLGQYRTNELVRRRMNFSSDAMADFEGLLEVNRKICKQQMAEKASPTLPTNCAVLPLLYHGKSAYTMPTSTDALTPQTSTGPAIVNSFAPMPSTMPSRRYSMAGDTMAFAKPEIGTNAPAPAY